MWGRRYFPSGNETHKIVDRERPSLHIKTACGLFVNAVSFMRALGYEDLAARDEPVTCRRCKKRMG